MRTRFAHTQGHARAYFDRHWRNQLRYQVDDFNESKILAYCDQARGHDLMDLVKFNEPLLKQGTPEEHHIAKH